MSATTTAVADAIEISLRAATLAQSLAATTDMPIKARITEIVLNLNQLSVDAEELHRQAQRETKKATTPS